MSKNIKQILSLFDGHAQAAQASGMKSVSGIENWVARGKIPHERRVAMYHNCESLGFSFSKKNTLLGLLTADYHDEPSSK